MAEDANRSDKKPHRRPNSKRPSPERRHRDTFYARLPELRGSEPATDAVLSAAVERVGGAEVVKNALEPKHDPQGNMIRWSAVCCQAAFGLAAGDPKFKAWLRLAATPVKDVKRALAPPARRRVPARPKAAPRPSAPAEARSVEAHDPVTFSDGPFSGVPRFVDADDRRRSRRRSERPRKTKKQRQRRRHADPSYSGWDD